jgi:glycosyltransferase involved in cell wall biosynthesis
MVTIVIPYFNQPLMYQKQLEKLNKLKGDFKVIFIDDCSDSPMNPDPKFTYYKILDDKGVNWQGAKNLGTLLADTEWVLHTDLDHTIPQETLDYINQTSLEKGKAYKFRRLLKGQEKDPHSNSFLIERQNFLNKGGYDLRWQGTKGGEHDFIKQLDFELLPVFLNTYGGDEIKDAMTNNDDKKLQAQISNNLNTIPPLPMINFKFNAYSCLFN